MAPNSKPAGAVARPAGLEYLADGNAARVYIPRELDEGHDVIELRKGPGLNSKRRWVVRVNNSPESFSISTQQLVSLRRFRKKVLRQLLLADQPRLWRWPADVLRLTEVSWNQIVVRLVTALKRGGVE
jgi:hypothetical protein